MVVLYIIFVWIGFGVFLGCREVVMWCLEVFFLVWRGGGSFGWWELVVWGFVVWGVWRWWDMGCGSFLGFLGRVRLGVVCLELWWGYVCFVFFRFLDYFY